MTALAVSGATYISVRAEADQLFDYRLRQTALSRRDQGQVAPDDAAALADPSVNCVVQIGSLQGLELYSSRPQDMTEPLPARTVLGYSHLRLGGRDWRAFSAAMPLSVVQGGPATGHAAEAGRAGRTAQRGLHLTRKPSFGRSVDG